MQISYTRHYFKTYLWQVLAIGLNLLSMFIVVPKLSELPSVYGIYSFIISFSIFFNYADMGFFSAGYKYASESYARQDLEDEVEISGFVCFFLFIFILLCASAFLFMAMKPQILIKDLYKADDIRIASHLLLILATFSPVVVFQRFLQIVYGVRIEAFINQRVQMGASILKIVSVFHFFSKGNYDIVGYFFFFQGMNLAACIVSAIIAKKRYDYDYLLFLRSVRFSRKMYQKTKSLAATSLYITFSHVIYYELDFFAIGQLLGAEKVAVYAIGFTVQSFIRSLFATLYTPFATRFNHFIGKKDIEGMRGLFRSVIIVTLPLVIFPVISMTLLMKPLVFCWVGGSYALSIPVAQFLIMSFIYSFISYPAGSVLIAQERIRVLYITGTIMPVFYWSIVASTINLAGINAFAVSKFLTHTVVNVIFLIIVLETLKERFLSFCRTVLLPIIIPCIFLIGSLLYLNPLLPAFKDKISLMITILTGATTSIISLFIYAAFSGSYRNYMKNILRKIFIHNDRGLAA